MKRRSLTVILIFIISTTFSIAQKVDWAYQIDPLKPEDSDITAITKKGSFIYAFGHSDGEVDLSPGTSGNTVARGYFLTKLNLEREVIWSTEILTEYREDVQWNGRQLRVRNSILIDDSDNILVSGNFRDKLRFPTADEDIVIDADEFAEDSHNGLHLPFVAKFDSDGFAKEVKVLATPVASGITPDAQLHSMEFGNNNDLYVSGKYRIGTIFERGESNEVTLEVREGGLDGEGIFLAKYDKDFNFQWVRNIAQENNQGGSEIWNSSIAIGSNKVYLATTFMGILSIEEDNSNVSIGSGPNNTRGKEGGALLVFDGDGEYLIGEQVLPAATNSHGNYINDIELDSDENVYITGTVIGRGTLALGSSNEYEFEPFSSWKPFIARFNSNLELQWARSFIAVESPGSSVASAAGRYLECEPDGTCVMAGEMGDSKRFLDLDLETLLFEVNTNYASPLYLMAFNSNGEMQKSLLMEPYLNIPQFQLISDYNRIRGMHMNGLEDILVSGRFTQDLAIGSGLLSEITLSGPVYVPFNQAYNLFLASLDLESEDEEDSDDDGDDGGDGDDIVTAIEDVDLSRQMLISPNPVDNILSVVLPETTLGWSEYRIISSQGSAIKDHESIENNHIEDNVQNLPSGIYILEVINKQTLIRKKFIKR